MKSSITLILPTFNPQNILTALPRGLPRSILLPNLKKLLARSVRQPVQYTSHEAFLFSLFYHNKLEALPTGAVSGLADGLTTAQGYWLRADPVELQPDLAAVYFTGHQNLMLSTDETTEIVKQINALLNQDGLTLHAPNNKRWYFSCDFNPAMITYAPSAIIGKDITYFLPSGINKNLWRKWLTEIQMLLNNCEVNQQRALHNLPLVNSLWLWGAGALPKKPEIQWQKIWSNDVLARGLAMLGNVPYDNEPKSLNEHLQEIKQGGNYLVLLDNTDLLEQHWFNPLVTALRKRQINTLTLYLNDNFIYHVTAKTIWRLWK